MKIGVVGLLSDQAQRVQHDFPMHDLRFFSKDRGDMDAFIAGVEKVVLMTKFIGHSMQDKVPMRKRVLLTGGETKLKDWLKTAPGKVITVTPPQPAVDTIKESAMPRGKPMTDWSFLKKHKVGDNVVIKRPPHLTADSWQQKIDAGRSYYKTKHGIHTTPKLVAGGVQLTITKVEEVAKKSSKRSVVTDAPVTTPAEGPMPAAVPAMTMAMPGVITDTRRAFWRNIIEARTTTMPGITAQQAIEYANAVMAAERELFGGQ